MGTQGTDDAALAVSQRWWDEIWRDGRLDAVDELFTETFVRHTRIEGGRIAEHWAATLTGVDWTV